MIDYNKITKVFDAKYNFVNGKEHFKKRKSRREIPKDMGLNQYLKESEKRSLKDIDGRNVRAYKAGGRTVKNDREWTTVYTGGKNGVLISSYPQKRNRFENIMKRDKGVEIFKE